MDTRIYYLSCNGTWTHDLWTPSNLFPSIKGKSIVFTVQVNANSSQIDGRPAHFDERLIVQKAEEKTGIDGIRTNRYTYRFDRIDGQYQYDGVEKLAPFPEYTRYVRHEGTCVVAKPRF